MSDASHRSHPSSAHLRHRSPKPLAVVEQLTAGDLAVRDLQHLGSAQLPTPGIAISQSMTEQTL
jgi:hypothetical protein